MFGPTLIPWHRSKIKIVAVSFFVTFFLQDSFLEFDLTLRANNSTLKTARKGARAGASGSAKI